MGFYDNPLWESLLKEPGFECAWSLDDCIWAEKKCIRRVWQVWKMVPFWKQTTHCLGLHVLLPWIFGHEFLHIFAMTKPYQKHQHESTFNIFVAVNFFGFASLFSKICSFSEVPFYGPVLQCAATISSTQKVLLGTARGELSHEKKRPNFPLNHLLVNRDSCNGLWRNPHIRVV